MALMMWWDVESTGGQEKLFSQKMAIFWVSDDNFLFSLHTKIFGTGLWCHFGLVSTPELVLCVKASHRGFCVYHSVT
jgi:hypothetical protein